MDTPHSQVSVPSSEESSTKTTCRGMFNIKSSGRKCSTFCLSFFVGMTTHVPDITLPACWVI